jgi:MFS transporter, ACS family, D-galactonate transporter
MLRRWEISFRWFADKVGARISLLIAIFWWSIFYRADCRRPQRSRISRLPASPGNWRDWRLSFLREGDCGLVSAKRAGLASGLFDSGSRIGSALSIPLVSWLISSFGRRESFLVTSVLGFIWAIFRIWLCRDLERHSSVTPEQLA